MASSNAPSTPSPAAQPPVPEQKKPMENPFIHNVALGVTPISLLAMWLPPRKFDIRMIILGGVAVWGTNQLTYDYSGRSFAQRFQSRMAKLTGHELPEKAQRTQMLLRQERARREAMLNPAAQDEDRQKVDDQKKLLEGQQRGTLERIWMGNEDDDWKKKREEREKAAFQEGGSGVWGLITDQLSEVWNGVAKKEQEAQEKEKAQRRERDS
jgi:hypothetical protein